MDSSDDVGAAVDASGSADGVRRKKRPLISRKAEGRGRGDGSDAEAPGSQEDHNGDVDENSTYGSGRAGSGRGTAGRGTSGRVVSGRGDADDEIRSQLRPPAENVIRVKAEVHSENAPSGEEDEEKTKTNKQKEEERNESEEETAKGTSRPPSGRTKNPRCLRMPSEGTINKLQDLRMEPSSGDNGGSDTEDGSTKQLILQPRPPSKRDIDQVSMSSNDDVRDKETKMASEERHGNRRQRKHPLGLRRFRRDGAKDRNKEETEEEREEAEDEIPSSTEPEEDGRKQRQRRKSRRRTLSADKRGGRSEERKQTGSEERRIARSESPQRDGEKKSDQGHHESVLAGSSPKDRKSRDAKPVTSSPRRKIKDGDNSDSALPPDEEMTSFNSGTGSMDSPIGSSAEEKGPIRLSPIKSNHPPKAEPWSRDIVSYAMKTSFKRDASVKDYTDSLSSFSPDASHSDAGLRQRLRASQPNSAGIPKLSTTEARQRSFLVGGISTGSSGRSLLGSEELNRLFPKRKLSVFVATYNFNGSRHMPDCLDDFLLPPSSEFMNDVYVIGSQEHTFNQQEWDVKLQETLGPSFVLYHSSSHGVLHSAIFMRRDLIWYVSLPDEATVTTRPVSQIKTKGAIGTSFSIFGSSFLIINSHMAANRSHQPDRLQERIQDYAKIASQLTFKNRQGPSKSKSASEPRLKPAYLPNASVGPAPAAAIKAKDDSALDPQCHCDVTEQFDYCIWLGDLNFRLRRRRDSVERMLKDYENELSASEADDKRSLGRRSGGSEVDSCDYDLLCTWDELRNQMTEGTVFRGFQEGRIQFPPSYKYDVGTKATFDTSHKQRVPAYTDRILYRSRKKNQLSCVAYDVCLDLLASDHKPVFGVYEALLRPGRDHLHLTAGQFNRDVYLEANRRRANHLMATPPPKTENKQKDKRDPVVVEEAASSESPTAGEKTSSVCNLM